MKDGECHARANSLARQSYIIRLARQTGIKDRKNASFFAQKCRVSTATIHRDIDFINAQSSLFKGSLKWEAHRQSYLFIERPDKARARKSELSWLEDHIELEHPDIDDKIWKPVMQALLEGKGLGFDYHDMHQLVHKTGLRLTVPSISFKEGEWFLKGQDGEGIWNMRYITGLVTF